MCPSLLIKNRVSKDLPHNQQHIIKFYYLLVNLKFILALSEFKDIRAFLNPDASHHYIQNLFKLFTKLTQP